MRDKRKQAGEEHHEPTVAPGMNGHDPLEAKATDKEVAEGEATLVTRLYVDHTPED